MNIVKHKCKKYVSSYFKIDTMHYWMCSLIFLYKQIVVRTFDIIILKGSKRYLYNIQSIFGYFYVL